MLIQILLHHKHEPLTHVSTFYQGNTKMYRGQTISNKPYSQQARVQTFNLPASQCSLYWITPYRWLNRFLERSTVLAWNKFKDSQPEHQAKRNWPIGTKYRFVKGVADSHIIDGVEYIQYKYMPQHTMELTEAIKRVLNQNNLWHCIERNIQDVVSNGDWFMFKKHKYHFIEPDGSRGIMYGQMAQQMTPETRAFITQYKLWNEVELCPKPIAKP